MALVDHPEARGILALERQPPGAVDGVAKAHDRRPGAHLEHPVQRRLSVGDQQAAAPGDGAHQVVELPLDGGQVIEDIRVVELQVAQDGDLGAVVDELGALVEEGRIVLVGFNHEGGIVSAETGRDAEVAGHPADQKPRRKPRRLQQPGQQARGGGLAVSAGHGDRPSPGEHFLSQPLGAGYVGQPLVQHRLDFGVTPGEGIADHYAVRPRREITRRVSLAQRDARLLELGTHRRIDIGIRAADGVAQLASEQRQATHEGATDAEDVEVHACSGSS